MPSIVRVHIHAARNLPVMDALTKLADAYVELSFGRQPSRRTDVVRKSLCPSWDWSTKLELTDDNEARREPLVFTVFDKDFIQDDVIGQVVISLEPLLADSEPGSPAGLRSLHGWLPIYDTLEGLRGELLITVRASHFGDRQQAVSSINRELVSQEATSPVAFYTLCSLDTALYPQQVLMGFVEELVVENDPEYTVADTFRTSRLSNQQRQLLLHRLAYQLRAMISAKARKMGGNAVLGFVLNYDVEGDSGIVARAYGTCVRLLQPPAQPVASQNLFSSRTPHALHARSRRDDSEPSGRLDADGEEGTLGATCSSQPSRIGPLTPLQPAATGRSQASSVAAERASATLDDVRASAPSAPNGDAATLLRLSGRRTRQGRRFDVRLTLADVVPLTANLLRSAFEPHNLVHKISKVEEVQLFSVMRPPPWVRVHIGGLVAVRSVKYLGRLQAKAYDTETRDRWYAEMRDELRSHAASLSCSQVLGYRETAVIVGDVCLLSVIGTAVRMRNALPGRRKHSSSRHRQPSQRAVAAELREKLNAALLQRPWYLPLTAIYWHERDTSYSKLHAPRRHLDVAAPRVVEISVPPAATIDALAPGDRVVAAVSDFAAGFASGAALEPVRQESAVLPAHVIPASSANTTADAPRTASRRHSSSRSKNPKSTRSATAAIPKRNFCSSEAPPPDTLVTFTPDAAVVDAWSLEQAPPCSFVHVPYAHAHAPFNNMRLSQCHGCRRSWVPSVVIATIELPAELPVSGPGVFIESRVVRRKDKVAGNEAECVQLSDELLFLEFAMHQQLMLKLKLLGRNAIFALRSSIAFHGSLVVGVTSGTAVYVEALPPPPSLQLRRSDPTEAEPPSELEATTANASLEPPHLLAYKLLQLEKFHRSVIERHRSAQQAASQLLSELTEAAQVAAVARTSTFGVHKLARPSVASRLPALPDADSEDGNSGSPRSSEDGVSNTQGSRSKQSSSRAGRTNKLRASSKVSSGTMDGDGDGFKKRVSRRRQKRRGSSVSRPTGRDETAEGPPSWIETSSDGRQGGSHSSSGSGSEDCSGASADESSSADSDNNEASASDDASSDTTSSASASNASRSSQQPQRHAAVGDSLRHYVVEVDDEQAEDLNAAVQDLYPPPGLGFVTTDAPPSQGCVRSDGSVGPPLLLSHAPVTLFDMGGSGGKCVAPRAGSTPPRSPGSPLHRQHLLPAVGATSPSFKGLGSASRPRNCQLLVLTLRMRWIDLEAPTTEIIATNTGSSGVSGAAAQLPLVSQGAAHPSGSGSAGGHDTTGQPPTWYGWAQQLWPVGALVAATGAAAPSPHASADSGSALTATRPPPESAAAGSRALMQEGAALTSDALKVQRLFHVAHALLAFKLRLLAPCTVCGVRVQLTLPEPEVAELLITGMVTREVGIWLADAAARTPSDEGGFTTQSETVGLVLGPRFQAAVISEQVREQQPHCSVSEWSSSTALGLLRKPLFWPSSMLPLLPAPLSRLVAARCALDTEALRQATYVLASLHREAFAVATRAQLRAHQSRFGGDVSSSSSPSILKNGPLRGDGQLLLSPASPKVHPQSYTSVEVTSRSAIDGDIAAAVSAADEVFILTDGRAAAAGNDNEYEDDDDEADEDGEDEEEDDDQTISSKRNASRGATHRTTDRRSVGDASTAASTVAGGSTARVQRTLGTPSGGVGSRSEVDPARTGGVSATGAPHPSTKEEASGSRGVVLTPLQHVPGARVVRYLGCLSYSFIRESLAVRQGGGLSSFTERLVSEANAVVRGQASALGGNAVLNYRIVPRESAGKVARNQTYHLISISGDCVELNGLPDE